LTIAGDLWLGEINLLARIIKTPVKPKPILENNLKTEEG